MYILHSRVRPEVIPILQSVELLLLLLWRRWGTLIPTDLSGSPRLAYMYFHAIQQFMIVLNSEACNNESNCDCLSVKGFI